MNTWNKKQKEESYDLSLFVVISQQFSISEWLNDISTSWFLYTFREKQEIVEWDKT